MDVRSGGRAGYRMAKGYERNALRSQIAHQRLSLRAVRLYCDINGVAMIEAELIVHRSLTVRANWQ